MSYFREELLKQFSLNSYVSEQFMWQLRIQETF